MAELTKSQKARLGAFLLTGAVLLVGSVVLLAGLRLWEKRDLYTVRYGDSVSGLEVNATVKYRGLRVGRVEAMRIAPDDPSLIEVTLSLDPSVHLYKGAVARLDASGLTGLKSINLTGGDLRAGPISPGSELTAGSAAIDEITNKAAEIAVRLDVIAAQLSRWTSDENRARVERLIDGLDSFARNSDKFLARAEQPVLETLRAISQTSSAAAEIATEGTATLKSVRGEVERTLQAVRRPFEGVDPKEVSATLAQARSTLHEMEQRLDQAELGRSLSSLTETMKRVDRLIQDLDLAVTAGRQDFTMSLAHLREATEDLREFSRIIAQDPSVLLRGTEVAE